VKANSFAVPLPLMHHGLVLPRRGRETGLDRSLALVWHLRLTNLRGDLHSIGTVQVVPNLAIACSGLRAEGPPRIGALIADAGMAADIDNGVAIRPSVPTRTGALPIETQVSGALRRYLFGAKSAAADLVCASRLVSRRTSSACDGWRCQRWDGFGSMTPIKASAIPWRGWALALS